MEKEDQVPLDKWLERLPAEMAQQIRESLAELLQKEEIAS
jgi:hypothetical protein